MGIFTETVNKVGLPASDIQFMVNLSSIELMHARHMITYYHFIIKERSRRTHQQMIESQTKDADASSSVLRHDACMLDT